VEILGAKAAPKKQNKNKQCWKLTRGESLNQNRDQIEKDDPQFKLALGRWLDLCA